MPPLVAWHQADMSLISIRFSQALAKGRRTPALPDTRERLLVTLLRKRAAARAVGADDLEALLRAQILWSLPTLEAELPIQAVEREAA